MVGHIAHEINLKSKIQVVRHPKVRSVEEHDAQRVEMALLDVIAPGRHRHVELLGRVEDVGRRSSLVVRHLHVDRPVAGQYLVTWIPTQRRDRKHQSARSSEAGR